MGSLHLIQGALMLLFCLTIDKIGNFLPPVRTYFLTFDTAAMRLVTVPKDAGTIPFGILVACFLFLFALAHFVIAFPGVMQPQ